MPVSGQLMSDWQRCFDIKRISADKKQVRVVEGLQTVRSPNLVCLQAALLSAVISGEADAAAETESLEQTTVERHHSR